MRNRHHFPGADVSASVRPSARGLLLMGLLAACSGSSDPASKPKKKKAKTEATSEKADAAPEAAANVPKRSRKDSASVVLITMDTTRRDRIGAYGYEMAHTPAIDAIANHGIRFDRAYSVVPLTTPSHASMMTGLYPTRHGIHNNGDAILSDDFTTIAETLSGEGYATAAAVSAFVTTRIWNLDQGFGDYFDEVKADRKRAGRGRWAQERTADAVVDDLIGWLDAHQNDDRPFFLWAHFYDPHDPYAPPTEWANKLEGRPYDGEIAFMDSQIARLKEAVDKRTGDAGTAWVLIADHGEALNREHGEHSHGMYLYDTTMRIPFIIQPPKPLEQAAVYDAGMVSNVDLNPTILGMLGFKPQPDIDGNDLTPAITGGVIDRAPVYMEAESAKNRFGFAPEQAMAHGTLKLIDTPNPRLFDVVADPKEDVNLVASKADDVKRLQEANKAIQARRADTTGAGMASPEVLAQLEALGYMTSDGNAGDSESAKLDAKDQSELINKLERARAMTTKRGKFKEAIQIYEEVLRDYPHIAEARMSLGKVLDQVGRTAEAERVLKEAIEIEPASTVLKSNLAAHYMRHRKYDEALAYYEMILTQVPMDDIARNGVIGVLVQSRRLDEALARAQAWKQQDPTDRTWDAHLGVILARMNRVVEAQPYLLRAIEDDMPRQDVHGTLAIIANASGDKEAAKRHLIAESDWFPTNLNVRMQLGVMLNEEGNWEESAAEFEFVVKMRPRDALARRWWAQAVFNSGDYPGAEAILKPALAIAPDDPYVLLLQANILQKLGQDEEAKKVFALATQLHEDGIRRQAAGQGLPDDEPGVPLPMGLEDDPSAELEQYGIPE